MQIKLCWFDIKFYWYKSSLFGISFWLL